LATSEVLDSGSTATPGDTAPHVRVDDAYHEYSDFQPDLLEDGLDVHAVEPGDELWDPAERFVYRIFRVSGFCEPSHREYVEETEPWREQSRLHVITDGPAILGVTRTVIGPYNELPVSQFEPEIDLPDGPLCEIGSLAVKATQRGLGVANELHRRAFWEGIQSDVAGFCFLIDEWMFEFFRSHYGLPVRALAPARPYMGGDVVPTGMWLPEMLHVLFRTRPNVYRWAVDGLPPELFRRLDLPIVLPR
jgi:hypothetical protein